MSHIRIIGEGDASGPLKREYDAGRRRAGRVWNILKVQCHNPAALHDSMRFYLTLMHGESPLSRAQREAIATVVSAANGCRY